MSSFSKPGRWLGVAAVAALASCATPEASIGESYTRIELENTLSIERKNEVVEIPLTVVTARYPKFDPRDFSVHALSNRHYPDRGDNLLATDPAPELPAQVIDRDFDGNLDTLLVISDFNPGERRFLAVSSPRFSLYAKKSGPVVTGGLFQRESMRRESGALKADGKYAEIQSAVLEAGHAKGDGLYQCDGPIFETDTSAWRLLFDSRMALDVVGKRDRILHLGEKNAAFLADYMDLSKQDWGGSLLAAGDGFAGGAFGFAEAGSIVPLAGFDSAQFRMIRDGAAATEAEAILFGAKVGREAFDLRWRMTHFAGGRIIRHDVNVSRSGHALAFAMSADGTRKEISSGATSWLRVTSWGASNVAGSAGGELGLAILANGRTTNGFVKNPADVIGVEFDSIARNVTFYTVAAWDQEASGLRSAQDFQKYVDELAQRLDTPIKVTNLDKQVHS